VNGPLRGNRFRNPGPPKYAKTAKTHPKDRSARSNVTRLAGSVNRPWEDSASRGGSLRGYMCWDKWRAKRRCGVKRFVRLYRFITCTSHPQMACMAVALAVGVRSDNTIGNLDSFRWAEGASRNRGRWPLVECMIIDLPSFQSHSEGSRRTNKRGRRGPR
jgi:hypothetical protein